ncbi:Predicted transcriptional regulator [Oligella urethralis]|uniref:HVO_A0114 family putative DNA-binding protein n=1 Tax=Oligella urethralis TaxID=90245 RepID=UPI000E08C78D|nr:helix-turn-helix domain-containing protein [Oligella urethralis]SUA55272.1 Predicted transcriptional regulator [Oligella urethralis]
MKNLKQSRCVIGIKGQMPDPDFPVDIWFDSLKSVANVLSKENQQLLKVIAEQQPQSVTELAALTGRAVSNVSRTLKTLDRLGIVRLTRISGQVKPTIKFRSFIVVGDHCE